MAKPKGEQVNETPMNDDNYADWSEEQIGFAPYWEPNEGLGFVGTPVAIDARDPDFVRFLFIAQQDIECFRGSAASAESVLVKKGERFSIGSYFALVDALGEFLTFQQTTGKPLTVRVDAVRKVKTAKKQDCWQFRVRVKPSDAPALKVVTSFTILSDLTREVGADWVEGPNPVDLFTFAWRPPSVKKRHRLDLCRRGIASR